jgi:cell division protein FtsQ
MIRAHRQVQLGVMLIILLGIVFSWPFMQQAIANMVPIRHVQVEGAFQYIDKQDIISHPWHGIYLN